MGNAPFAPVTLSLAGMILHALTRSLAAMSLVFRQPVGSFIRLETADRGALVSRDGDYATILHMDGIRAVLGQAELDKIAEAARMALAPYLDRPGHAIQIHFARDPDRSADEIRRMLAPGRESARQIGLELGDLFAEKERVLPRVICWEACHLVLWTRGGVLTREEARQSAEAAAEVGRGAPVMTDAQAWPWKVSEILRPRHDAVVAGVRRSLAAAGLSLQVLGAHDALRVVRESIYPETAGSAWRPKLPGDRVAARLKDEPAASARDVSELLWPPLHEQICSTVVGGDAERLSASQVRIGDRDWAVVEMALGPEQPSPFGGLIHSLSGSEAMPWRVSMLIEGGGLELQTLKRSIASLLAWTGSQNTRIRDAVNKLAAMKLEGADVPIKLRVSLATWAPRGQEALLRRRAALLARGLEAWGCCHAGVLCGDPLEGVLSSGVALGVQSTAPAGAAPLGDVARMMPWGRASSPWAEGPVLFRTPDGKPFPYEPGGRKRDAWIDLVVSPPGGGKSVWMNTVSLGMCLSADARAGSEPRLPRIAILDIGPSSSGLVSLLREALPEHRRHEAVYRRLQMTPDNAINPFDTQLGCRYPMPLERSFLVNFISLLSTPLGERAPHEGIEDLVGFTIDEVFRMFDDKAAGSAPRRYEPGIDAEVDEALEAEGMIPPRDGRVLWWEVVDALCSRGRWREAGLAQRHAVPLLADLVAAARARQITDLFGALKTPTGESAIEALMRSMSSALKAYPILSRPTRFDLGGARVVALDLDDVAPKGGAQADRQTAVMYLLARHAVARDFYLNTEILERIPPRVRGFHAKRIAELRESPKRLVFDEFHRTASSDLVRNQVKIDIREGRKWGVQIVLASQLLRDFDADIVDQATGIQIMRLNSEHSIAEAAELFGLSATAQWVIANRLNGPGPGGAPFLSILKTKEGTWEQMLVNTLGPVELWAFSTTAEDAELRRRLYARLSPGEARRRLAAVFPSGSAREEIDARKKALMAEGSDPDAAAGGVIDGLVAEICAGTGVGAAAVRVTAAE